MLSVLSVRLIFRLIVRLIFHKNLKMTKFKRRQSCFQPSRQPSSAVKVWQLYKKESTEIEKSFDEKYKKFHREPESHPKYREEWKKFWLHRSLELQRDGTDINSYDFKPEWKKFIVGRLSSFKQSEIKEKLKTLFVKCLAITEGSSEINSKTFEKIAAAKKSRKSSYFSFKSAKSSRGEKRWRR